VDGRGGGAVADAQVVVEQTTSTTVDGKALPSVHARVLWGGRKVRLESGDALEPLVLLLDLEHDRAYRLDPPSRSAVALDLDGLRARASLGFAQAGEAMNADEPDSFRTSALPGRRRIAGRLCDGYRVRHRQTQIDVWVSTQVSIGMELFADFLEWSGADQSLAGLLPEIRKLEGFPLETESHVVVDGHVYDTKATVTAVSVAPRDPSLFEVPAAFTLEDEVAPRP
jgi:hypothetical protein